MHTVQLAFKAHIEDVAAGRVERRAQTDLGISTGRVKSSRLYVVAYPLSESQAEDFARSCLQDPVTDAFWLNQNLPAQGFACAIVVAKLPGVTDDEGTSAQMALVDYFDIKEKLLTQCIFSQSVFYFENALTDQALRTIARRLLGNPLIHRFDYFRAAADGSIAFEPYMPDVRLNVDTTTETIELQGLSDEQLVQLSKEKVLALNLSEMQAIRDHYANPAVQAERAALGLPAQPTDCELEILAQTWSEHCKHKEFNAVIHYHNRLTDEQLTIRSLFKTYIKAATERVQARLEAKGNDWLIKVFSDNAGVVRANDRHLFVWKVETHNSPSALDPYGGAITGILGNNRDPHGTGIGGGRLLFNTNVLCFGTPQYDRPLLSGQLHPRQIMEGVIAGIEAGGNKSGVPTINGSIVFDDRFGGKPLVYCGTGGLMPHQYQGKNTWEKHISPGDRIVVGGGRVGKDGIHGATFSSIEIDEHSPMSAVQIGSPITQKKLYDFLVVACERGLVKCSTDNGAGGLSSSIGELATLSGGAQVDLERVPLKYSGLRPWEIFVSESQERMTLVVENERMPYLYELAELYEVELSDIGCFTDSGRLEVRYEGSPVACLDMEFLHEGVPQKVMYAEWSPVRLPEPELPQDLDYNAVLLQLMGSLNICSREGVIRQYDHEVKGKTIVKPLMGSRGKAPQDAAVMRLDFESMEGVAVSNGILPRYGDVDAYEMSAGAFDEAVRQIISVGGCLPNLSQSDGIFWSVNDNFCVPDSEYHPTGNPDGKEKLAKLVQMCQALYDMATYFDIPLTSGKDSMKNDLKADGVKISVPPTILYSMAAKMPDVRRAVTSEFKAPGDWVYQLGETYAELGCSEFHRLFGAPGNAIPQVRKSSAKSLYVKVSEANSRGWIVSSHDLSDGGLAVALAESCFGGNLGADLVLDNFKNKNLSINDLLFSESHSRFVVSVRPEDKESFEAHFGNRATLLGRVTEEPILRISRQNTPLIELSSAALQRAWEEGGAFLG